MKHMKMEKSLKVAIVCDWLTEIGGAEKVLLEVHGMFPNAPIYTSQYRAKSAPPEFSKADVRTGWLNGFPRALRRFLSPLRYFYFAHLDLSNYDLVISICNAEAKNIKTHGKQSSALHISYLQGPPTQYYWGLYDQYIKNPGFGKLNFLARFGLKVLVKPLRKVDYKSAQKPDFLLANSTYVRNEIKKYYNREAEVLWPNVDVKTLQKIAAKMPREISKKKSTFMVSGRQVGWKRLDIAVAACTETGVNLLLIGDGPDHENLVKLAAENPKIQFLPRYNGAAEIIKYLRAATAFIFPSIEPFGIAPIEALAVGTPVIALRQGGSLDFIREDENGRFFNEQTVDSLVAAIRKFEKSKFDSKVIARSVEKFSDTNFRKKLQELITKYCDKEI